MIDLSLQDAAFIDLDSANTPMHVCYLLLFSKPARAPKRFVKKLAEQFAQQPVITPPFNYLLRPRRFPGERLKWEASNSVDIQRHLNVATLPSPGGERELGELVSGFHGEQLPRGIPLWQMILIDGLDNNRFGLCLKMHHALADGLRLLKITSRCLSDSPKALPTAPWSAPLKKPETPQQKALDGWRDFFFGLVKKDKDGGPKKKYQLPKPPPSVLNGAITGNRRVATQSIPLARVKAIAKAAQVSLNDIVIALCSKSLRQYLLDTEALPENSLVAGMPIALKNSDHLEYGNALGGITVAMATDVGDDRERINRIHSSTTDGKQLVHNIPNSLNKTIGAVSMYIMKTKVAMKRDLNKTAPASNLTISNLPGSKEPLFLKGAALTNMYPASVLMPDQRLTIMLISYADNLNFGFVGCPDHLPHLQKIAERLPACLSELERAYNL